MSETNASPNDESIVVSNVSLNELTETAKPVVPTVIDPAMPNEAKAFEDLLTADFDSWSQWKYQDEQRKRLGSSSIGETCAMKLWLTFRWAKQERFDGRMLRLFERGKKEEPSIFEMMRGIGFQVHDIDPSTGKQYAFNRFSGHYGGSLDAVAIAPERYMFNGVPMLVSVKTSGTGSAFNKYQDDAMQIANPRYWAQECSYGDGFDINYALWLIVNKNDDTIRARVQKLDREYGRQLTLKAERIILSRVPMERVSKSPAFKACATCHLKGVCHKGEELDRNCRSCKHAVPSPQAKEDGSPNWNCEFNQGTIPDDVIKVGCGEWISVMKGD